MLSFVHRHSLLRSRTLLSARGILPCVIPPNRPLTWSVQRGFATSDALSRSTADSEPESKHTSTKTKSGRKVTHKETTEGKTKLTAKKPGAVQKITIKRQDFPPKGPGSAFILWFTDWIRTQPKADGLLSAQNYLRQAAQTWYTVSEDEKELYREKFKGLKADHHRCMEEWREQIDPVILSELNRRRAARGLKHIRGRRTGRPPSGFFRYLMEVRKDTTWTPEQGVYKDFLTAFCGQAGRQWRAMSEAEKAKYTDPANVDFAAWREKREAEAHAKQ